MVIYQCRHVTRYTLSMINAIPCVTGFVKAQMLMVGRGLMSNPRILLIGEPSLGLAPVIVQEMFATLAKLKADGRTIVLVKQNTQGAVKIADRVYLMQSGKVMLSQPAQEVNMEELHQHYLAR